MLIEGVVLAREGTLGPLLLDDPSLLSGEFVVLRCHAAPLICDMALDPQSGTSDGGLSFSLSTRRVEELLMSRPPDVNPERPRTRSWIRASVRSDTAQSL